jgi:hypothetical protein
MTQDEIIAMAREAGWQDLRELDAEMREPILIGNPVSLERFAALVEQRVRSEIALEELAKINQELGGY